METGETGRFWALGRFIRVTILGGARRREVLSSELKELTERIRPFDDARASFFSFVYRFYVSFSGSERAPRLRLTSVAAAAVSSGSLKTIDLSPILNFRFLNDAGVDEAARGYCRVSRSLVARGGRMIRGGNEVVVVVVVVTTVVRVVGANENCPNVVLGGPCPRSFLSCSSIAGRRE